MACVILLLLESVTAGAAERMTFCHPRSVFADRETACDPFPSQARTQVMFAEHHQSEEVGASVFAVAYSGHKGRVVDCDEHKILTVNEDQDAKWVACVERIRREQDQAAFAELFRHFAPRVKGFLMKSGVSEALAEECTQDVMATLWRKSHLYDPSRASVATWVFTIARNRKIDMLRKYNRPEPEDLPWGPEEEPDQADVIALQQESRKLTQALLALPEKQRELLEKAYFGDLSHSEIAAETGLPLGTIKSRIRLALERLRHAMK